MNPTEPAGPVPSGVNVRSRVVDIRKDIEGLRAGCSGTPQSLPERNELESGGEPPTGADGQPTPDHKRW